MTKKATKALAFALTGVLAVGAMTTPVDAARKPTLKKTLTMKVGEKKTLALQNAKKLTKKQTKKVKWKVSKKGIVSLSIKGKYRNKVTLKGKKAGTVTVQLKYGKATYKTKVTVKKKTTTSTVSPKPDNTDLSSTSTVTTTQTSTNNTSEDIVGGAGVDKDSGKDTGEEQTPVTPALPAESESEKVEEPEGETANVETPSGDTSNIETPNSETSTSETSSTEGKVDAKDDSTTEGREPSVKAPEDATIPSSGNESGSTEAKKTKSTVDDNKS